eukprot:752809-Hanusia_phi.AAC.2
MEQSRGGSNVVCLDLSLPQILALNPRQDVDASRQLSFDLCSIPGHLASPLLGEERALYLLVRHCDVTDPHPCGAGAGEHATSQRPDPNGERRRDSDGRETCDLIMLGKKAQMPTKVAPMTNKLREF